jgi:hypothetical protein
MSPTIRAVPVMEPSQGLFLAFGEGGTTSATGSPNLVTRFGLRVLRTRSRTAKHVALNLEIAISSMMQPRHLYHSQGPWSTMFDMLHDQQSAAVRKGRRSAPTLHRCVRSCYEAEPQHTEEADPLILPQLYRMHRTSAARGFIVMHGHGSFSGRRAVKAHQKSRSIPQ